MRRALATMAIGVALGAACGDEFTLGPGSGGAVARGRLAEARELG